MCCAHIGRLTVPAAAAASHPPQPRPLCPGSTPPGDALQGGKAELAKLLAADGLFDGVAKVGFSVAPGSVRYQEMSWIQSVVVNGGYDNVKKPTDLLNIGSMYKYRRACFGNVFLCWSAVGSARLAGGPQQDRGRAWRSHQGRGSDGSAIQLAHQRPSSCAKNNQPKNAGPTSS